jgi:ATP-binding cassette subfamily F protein 3
MKRLGSLEEQYRTRGGYTLENSAKMILSGLGFSEADFNRPYCELSGGWGMRAHLARLLLQDPDLLLLDEPTNHLDIPSMEWLESYLLQFKGSMVVVSHDRFFIDRLVRKIYELNRGELIKYTGDYRNYMEQKARKDRLLRKKREEQLAERERLQRFINRYRSDKKRAAQVKDRRRMLENIDVVELPPPPPRLDFGLDTGTTSYKDVLQIRDMTFGYERAEVLDHINLSLSRGEKAALVGVNGSGKTTLTRLIVGQLSPMEGSVRLGQRTRIGYYAQHQIKALDPDVTVYGAVASSVSDMMVPRIKDVLGIFQFSGDDIQKKIKILSGGEKARVSLVKILLSPVNFLIMDEPTTHLDSSARDALEQALQGYSGSLLLISHDRYFLDKIVGRVFELKNRRLFEYYGNYSDYLDKKEGGMEEVSPPEYTAPGSAAPSGKKTRDQKRLEAEARQKISRERKRIGDAIDGIEEEIENLEAQKKEMEERLARPETYEKNREEIRLMHREYGEIQKEMDALYEKWEKLRLELETLLSEIS